MQKRTSDITTLRMQALSILSVPHPFLDFDDFCVISAKLDPYCNTKQEIHNDDEEIIEGGEFSFACTNTQEMPIFADEIFDNGKIRPILCACDQSSIFKYESNVFASPLRPSLKKIFIKQNNNFCSKPSDVSQEPHSDPSKNVIMVEVETSNDSLKKSNSTGFSKLWRFRRDLKRRSNSDVNDAFVFWNPPVQGNHDEVKAKKIPMKKGNGEKCKTIVSAHEKLYVMNRMRKESNKRKSFLPYKQHFFGLFFHTNTLSKNIHPF